MKVDLGELLDSFGDEYERLYDADVAGELVDGYHEMLEYGDQLIRECKDLICAFAQYRGDFLSSDREVAAFGFAVSKLF